MSGTAGARADRLMGLGGTQPMIRKPLRWVRHRGVWTRGLQEGVAGVTRSWSRPDFSKLRGDGDGTAAAAAAAQIAAEDLVQRLYHRLSFYTRRLQQAVSLCLRTIHVVS